MNDQKNTNILKSWFNDHDSYGSTVLSDGKSLSKNGEKKALKLFHEASVKVPAYRDFLKKHQVHPDKIKSVADYAQVPCITKENYIEKYEYTQRCWDGGKGNLHMISTSSGTTGKPHFWPRNLQTVVDGASLHEFIFREIFEVGKQRTLLVNGFALGNWIAGTYTNECCQLVSWKGYPLTVMSPGYDSLQVIETILQMSPHYSQTILTGHTPFIKEIVDNFADMAIDLKLLNLKYMGTGQAVTEKWRSYINSFSAVEDYYRIFINLYGSTDAALMGFETPFSIFIRSEIGYAIDKQFFKDERIPAVYAYDPRLIFFQADQKQLIITKNSGCPLIRYNIKDEGGILKFEDIQHKLQNILNSVIKKRIPVWEFPLVYLFGRSKFMVKIYGANIYTENVQSVLDHRELQKYLTGRFLLDMDYDTDNNPIMICRVEMRSNIQNADRIDELVKTHFIKEVTTLNSEYKYVYEKMGKKVIPKIIIHEHGDEKFFPVNKIKKTS